MKLIPYSVNSGAINMQTDENLLVSAISKHIKYPIFRLYGWSPSCISLGRNQDSNFLNKNLLDKYNIDVVRRMTGGRALLHDKELTYSYITAIENLTNGDSVLKSYKEISNLLINIFSRLGIKLELGGNKRINTKFDYCMLLSTGADLCWNNRKFIGSAQCRRNGYILQHGSILLDYNKELLEALFNEKIQDNSIVSLKEINNNITIEDIIKTVKETLN